MANQGAIQAERWSMVVVYDPATGVIVHSHQELTAPGGQHADDATIEKEALSHAAGRAGGAKLAALHVDPRGLKPDTHYRVDTTRHALVESAIPRQRAS